MLMGGSFALSPHFLVAVMCFGGEVRAETFDIRAEVRRVRVEAFGSAFASGGGRSARFGLYLRLSSGNSLVANNAAPRVSNQGTMNPGNDGEVRVIKRIEVRPGS